MYAICGHVPEILPQLKICLPYYQVSVVQKREKSTRLVILTQAQVFGSFDHADSIPSYLFLSDNKRQHSSSLCCLWTQSTYFSDDENKGETRTGSYLTQVLFERWAVHFNNAIFQIIQSLRKASLDIASDVILFGAEKPVIFVRFDGLGLVTMS
jgi:hypothetical protein